MENPQQVLKNIENDISPSYKSYFNRFGYLWINLKMVFYLGDLDNPKIIRYNLPSCSKRTLTSKTELNNNLKMKTFKLISGIFY